MNTVCENCWTMPPQIRPTIPNNVMMMRDSRSARPCPSKSYWEYWEDKQCKWKLECKHIDPSEIAKNNRYMRCGFLEICVLSAICGSTLTICVGNMSIKPILAKLLFNPSISGARNQSGATKHSLDIRKRSGKDALFTINTSPFE